VSVPSALQIVLNTHVNPLRCDFIFTEKETEVQRGEIPSQRLAGLAFNKARKNLPGTRITCEYLVRCRGLSCLSNCDMASEAIEW
jgi:hypothetical protein